MPDELQPYELPADLSALTADDLAAAEADAIAYFDAIAVREATPDVAAEAARAAEAVQALRAERGARQEQAREAAAALEAARALVHANGEEGDEGKGEEGDEGQGDDEGEPAPPAREPVGAGAVTASGGAVTAPRELGGLKARKSKLNVRLADAARQQSPHNAPARQDAVLVASADVPQHQQGQRLPNMRALADAVHARARTLSVTRRGHEAPRYNVAQLQRTFRHTLPRNPSFDQVDEILRRAADPQALVAAGGWCAPAEISYDFYNVITMQGAVDIPTIGIERGGLQVPISPSYADVVDAPWTWTEEDDIDAVTGGATKPCVRLECATHDEYTLECDGFCITAGNLTSAAWPEQAANFLRLVEAAHFHYVNGRVISAMVAASTAITGAGTSTDEGYVSPLLEQMEIQAYDLRARYKMGRNAVLEAVLPEWAPGPARADLSRRMGLSEFAVTDAMLAQWLDARDISAQFVDDWQSNSAGYFGTSTPRTTWPSSLRFLMYPAGTFVRGNGFTLDLGVVRDSTLNATNDHTAAWMEECWLLAKMGHESRNVAVDVCTSGETGAANITNCNTSA